jgi:hypothetical protein
MSQLTINTALLMLEVWVTIISTALLLMFMADPNMALSMELIMDIRLLLLPISPLKATITQLVLSEVVRQSIFEDGVFLLSKN